MAQTRPLESAGCSTTVVALGYTLLLQFTAFAASIDGTVTNSVTGERRRKAWVRLASVSDPANVRPVVTNEEGRFVFENLQPGSYSLEAEHQGLIESTYGGDAGAPVQLRVVDGQTLSGLNIRLAPPAAISGCIRDDDGDLWTHAWVDVFRAIWKDGKRQFQGFSSSEVNDAGDFRVGHLPPGRYYLSAHPDAAWEQKNRASSARLLETWFPGSLDFSSATPIVLLPAQEFTGAEIRMRRGSTYRIRGVVSGLQRTPTLPGPTAWMTPRLVASPVPELGGNDKGASLKPDGSFTVEGVTSETWQLRVEQGLMPRITLGIATIQLHDRDLEDVSVMVYPLHLLKGVVRIEEETTTPPPALSFCLDSDMLGGYLTATSGHDGSINFENVPSGLHRLILQGEASGKYYVKSLRYGSVQLPDTGFSISADSDTLEVTLSARGARVNGTVRRNGDTGSATPQVVLLPDTPSHVSHLGNIDQSGAFTLKEPLRAGEYTLYAFEGVPNGAWTDPEFIKEVRSKGVRIKVDEGDTKAVDVPLIPRSDVAALLTRLGMD